MIEKYKNHFIYPPRPELKISRQLLNSYDNHKFIAQPKLNGSCCEIYVDDDFIQKSRHNTTLNNFKISKNEIKHIFNQKSLVIGEYMNKCKNDENNNLFNNKFIIFDQLVYNENYLLGSTYLDRYEIMLKIYKPISETKFLYQLSDNIYMVKSFYNNFINIWDEITKIDMFEGLVLKQINGKLERGIRERNNNKTQLKCRKTSCSYNF